MKSVGLGSKRIMPIPKNEFESNLIYAIEDVLREIDENLQFVTRPNVRTVSANYTVGNNDQIVVADTAVTVTLPLAATSSNRVITIKDAVTPGSVTVAAQAGENIDGSNTYSLTTLYGAITVISDGTEWHIINNF